MRRMWMLLLFLVLGAASASAQTPCDTTSDFFVLPPDGTGVSVHLATTPADHAGTTTYRLVISRQDGGQALSTQDVSQSTATSVGALTSDPSLTCYALPLVPVAQIPKGNPVVVTVSARSSSDQLSSSDSSPSSPFGLRLRPPVVKIKP